MIQFDEFTVEEKEAIEELKKRVDHKLTPRLRKDETLYYRFLKARDFNLKNAETMLLKHLSDRKKYEIEELLDNNFLPPNMKEYICISFMCYDNEGAVVRYTDMGADIKGVIASYDFRKMLQFALEYLERDVDRMTEQSIILGKQVSKSVFILNMEKMSLAQVSNKKALDYAIEFFKVYQDNHPERIKSIYIINASVYFNIAFSIVKHVLASEVIRKFKIFGSTGWKEAFLEIINADELPAFLGGNLTDPDGDPLCRTIVSHAKKVPEEMYKKKCQKSSMSEGKDVKKLLITRFSCSEVLLNIYEPNTYLEWEFEIKQKDIAFGLYYKDQSKAKSELEELIPKQRIDTDSSVERGVYRCDKLGAYIIIFDNSYSWLHSKEIYYRVRLTKAQERRFSNSSQ